MMTDHDFDLERTFHAPRIDVCGVDRAGVNPLFGPAVFDEVSRIVEAELQEHVVMPAAFAIPSAIEFDSCSGKKVQATGMVDPHSPLSGVASG